MEHNEWNMAVKMWHCQGLALIYRYMGEIAQTSIKSTTAERLIHPNLNDDGEKQQHDDAENPIDRRLTNSF